MMDLDWRSKLSAYFWSSLSDLNLQTLILTISKNCFFFTFLDTRGSHSLLCFINVFSWIFYWSDLDEVPCSRVKQQGPPPGDLNLQRLSYKLISMTIVLYYTAASETHRNRKCGGCCSAFCCLWVLWVIEFVFCLTPLSPFLHAKVREVLSNCAMPISVIMFSFVGSYLFNDIERQYTSHIQYNTCFQNNTTHWNVEKPFRMCKTVIIAVIASEIAEAYCLCKTQCEVLKTSLIHIM